MVGTSKNRSAGTRFNYILIWISILPVLLSMWMIFGFSSQPAEQSKQTSHRVVDVVIQLFVPDYDMLDAAAQDELDHRITVIVRKTAHAVEYAILGFFLHLHALAWQQKRRGDAPQDTPPSVRRFRIPIWVWSGLAGMLYAVTDEVHQGFVANRGPQVSDVCLDTAGVMVGVAICALMWFIIRRCRRRRQPPS